jgi:hypothetical protein
LLESGGMRSLAWGSLALLTALAACSQSLSGELTGTGGAGAQTGDGGGGRRGSGSGGAAGSGVATCQALASEYKTALVAAQSCDVGAAGQCNQLMPSGLIGCGNCPTFVSDATKLNAILQLWQAASCNGVIPEPPCVSGACWEPVNGVCAPDPTGVGVCGYGSGTGGSSGRGGTGGSAVDGGQPDLCAALRLKYASVLAAATSCTPGAANQCAQAVVPTLSPCVNNCNVYVNDATALNDVRALWQQEGCGNVAVACPASQCLGTTNDGCWPTDGGAGVCATGYELLISQ